MQSEALFRLLSLNEPAMDKFRYRQMQMTSCGGTIRHFVENTIASGVALQP
jgi:hypothetical protein